MKCIEANVYRNCHHDSSNGGISSVYDTVLIPHKDGYIIVNEFDIPENLCQVVRYKIFEREYVCVRPTCNGDTSVFGGCFVYSSDDRFGEAVGNGGYPVPLHDRVE